MAGFLREDSFFAFAVPAGRGGRGRVNLVS